MVRYPRAKELANLKEALANFEHQLDAFEALVRQRDFSSRLKQGLSVRS